MGGGGTDGERARALARPAPTTLQPPAWSTAPCLPPAAYLSDQRARQRRLRRGLLPGLLLGRPHDGAAQGLLTGGGVVYGGASVGIHKGLACNGIGARSRWASQLSFASKNHSGYFKSHLAWPAWLSC